MRIVGLSGGIATGKSTVSRELAAERITVIDCDKLAKDATRKGTWGWRRVVAAFGKEILGPDGELDRERLGALIFSDPAARRRLNTATHIPVALALARNLLVSWLTFKWLVVVDMPLLFETKVYKLMRPNVLVACSPEHQLERLQARDGGSAERALARIGSQMPLDAKRQLAQIVVENDGTVEDLRPQLPSAVGAQAGPFVLQENSNVTLQDINDNQRRGFPCFPCGLFASSRQARYAGPRDDNGVRFALLHDAVKPSLWVLQADGVDQPGLARVEQLRGHVPEPPALPVPYSWPVGAAVGLGLLVNFDRDHVQSSGLSSASCHLLVDPPPGFAATRALLVAHAYWRDSDPGKLVLAMAQFCEADWTALVTGCGDEHGAEAPCSAQPEGQQQWRWNVLLVTEGFGYVGSAAGQYRAGNPTETACGDTASALTDIRMSWHPQGSALAMCLTDSSNRSCVAVVNAGTLETVWHRRWEPDMGPTMPAAGTTPMERGGASASAMAWVPGTSLLAVVDDEGNLCLLDAEGSPRGAAVLCGAIKYGESKLVRLGPILSTAAPLAASGKGAVADFPRFTRNQRHGSSGGGSNGTDSRSLPDQRHRQRQQQGGMHPQPHYSLAFTATGKGAASAAMGVATLSPVLAISNGAAVALMQMHLSEDAVSFEAAAAYASNCAANGTPFALGVSPAAAALSSSGMGDGMGHSHDRDVLPVVPSVALRTDPLGRAFPSFSSSAVSTPYMLGLQPVSGPFASAMPQFSCRSTASDVSVLPPWPLVWHTVLTLPPQSGLMGTAPTLTLAPSNRSQQQHPIGAPSSVAGSSVAGRPEPSLLRGSGACPSLAGSAANLTAPSLCTAVPEEAETCGGGLAHDSECTAAAAGCRGPSAAAGLVCAAPAALRALRQGDVLVLRGSMAQALHHYPRAHIYGFLPAFLALVHLHRVDAAARLLRSYAHFTGQVATAVAAAGTEAAAAAAPHAAASGPSPACIPTAAALRRQWRTAMAKVLAEAFVEHTTTTATPRGMGSSPGGLQQPARTSEGAGVTMRLPRRSYDEASSPARNGYCHGHDSSPTRHVKLRLPIDRFRNYVDGFSATAPGLSSAPESGPCSAEPERLLSGSEPLEASGMNCEAAGVAASAPGVFGFDSGGVAAGGGSIGGGRSVSQLHTLQEANVSTASMLSVPEESVLNAGVPQAVASGAAGCMLLPPLGEEGASSPTLPNAESPMGGSAAVHAAAHAAAAAAAAAAFAAEDAEAGEEEEELVLYDGCGCCEACVTTQSATAALHSMLRVCLQLLLLACQAMAFVAFSAHSAGRAAAAAAAVDMLALQVGPNSPRSPGMLSRQAMRRLSSTMRMRSLKTRSVSVYGHNVAGLAGSPPGHQPISVGGASPHRPVSNSVGGCTPVGTPGSTGGGAVSMTTPRPPPVAPVIIGFPVPVVWQPLPSQAAPQPLSPSSTGQGLPPRTEPPSSLVNSHGGQPPMGSVGSAADASISLAASGMVSVASSSPTAATRPLPTPMRLQLHHCAFDATQLWQDASAQHTEVGQSAASVYLKPSYAVGLMLMAHACTVQLQEQQLHGRSHCEHGGTGRQDHQGQQQQQSQTESAAPRSQPANQQQRQGQQQGQARPNDSEQQQKEQQRGHILHAGTGAARVNWPLLRASVAATHAAAVWQHLNDWHRAALLAFACANALSKMGGGTADLAVELPKRPRRSLCVDPPAVDEELQGAWPELPEGAAGGLAGAVSGSRSSGGILAAARASCLRMGQRVLLSQVGACQKMEVQDACGVLLELVALPRRLLGLESAVHVSLLQKVCTRVVDLLPKRVCITPLLPAGSVPPLLQLSHAGIRAQLVSHCGAAVARVLEELRLAAACSGAFASLRDTVQQIAEHATVDSTLRMLLRWQGAYDGSRVDATAARLPERVHDMMLLPDTSDWSAEAVLPPLQDALVASGLMSVTDAAAVAKAALAAASAAAPDGGFAPLSMATLEEHPLAAGAAAVAGPGASAGPGGAARGGLQDLDELALLLDLSQLQHTLLAVLQPFLHDALPLLRRQPASDPAEAAGGTNACSSTGDVEAALLDGGGPEEEQEDALVESMLEDPGVISAVPPVELAASCLKLLLKLQWAMHCRAQVCALMLRLLQLQAPPLPPLQLEVVHPAGSEPPPALHGHRSLVLQISAPCGALPTSPRSFSRGSQGHRSFKDYIQHMASETAAAAAAASVAFVPQGPKSHELRNQRSEAVPMVMPSAARRSTSQQHSQQHMSPFTNPQASDLSTHSSLEQAGGGGGAVDPHLLAEDLEAAQGALVAWTAALVRADVFHSGSDVQSCVLTVLTMVHTCPVEVVAALDKALRRRSLFNARLAEQVKRLKRGPPPPPPVAADSPAPSPLASPPAPALPQDAPALTGALDSPTHRPDRLHMPGGAMAPSPSLAVRSAELDLETRSLGAGGVAAALGAAGPLGSPSRHALDPKLAPSPLGRLASPAPRAPTTNGSDGAASSANGSARGGVHGVGDGQHHSGGELSMPSLPFCLSSVTTMLAEPTAPAAAAAAGRGSQHPQEQGSGSQEPRAQSQPPSTSAHAVTPPRLPPQLAVATAHATIRAASLKLLEYYADPSGAMPSGLSTTLSSATPAAPQEQLSQPHRGSCGSESARSGGCSGSGSAAAAAAPPAANGASGNACRSQNPAWRNKAVSRTTQHSTLLQCLVCELVRNAHCVTASVSWRASLEGGRGLASCFVHPVLYGAGHAAIASDGARGASVGVKAAAARGGRPTKPKGYDTVSDTEAADDLLEVLGSVPGFVPCAEGAQALLLSLMDVKQWAVVPKTLLPADSERPSAADGAVPTLDPGSRTDRGETKQHGAGAGDAPGRPAVPAAEEAEARRHSQSFTAGSEARPLSPGSPSGLSNADRFSMSALTDGDGDSCYPSVSPSAAATPEGADAKTAADRHGTSSMRRHINPAFGLHSPTPSNLSEYWDEASDMVSPPSTVVSAAVDAGGAAEGRASGRAGGMDARSPAWRRSSGVTSPEATPSPRASTRAQSPDTPSALRGSGAFSGMGRLSGTTTAASSRRATDAQGLETAAAGNGSQDADSKAAYMVAAFADSKGAGGSQTAAAVAADDAKHGGAGAVVSSGGGAADAGDGEQMPTLSYLINVNTLNDIRNAVREARGDGGAASGADASAEPVAATPANGHVEFRAPLTGTDAQPVDLNPGLIHSRDALSGDGAYAQQVRVGGSESTSERGVRNGVHGARQLAVLGDGDTQRPAGNEAGGAFALPSHARGENDAVNAGGAFEQPRAPTSAPAHGGHVDVDLSSTQHPSALAPGSDHLTHESGRSGLLGNGGGGYGSHAGNVGGGAHGSSLSGGIACASPPPRRMFNPSLSMPAKRATDGAGSYMPSPPGRSLGDAHTHGGAYSHTPPQDYKPLGLGLSLGLGLGLGLGLPGDGGAQRELRLSRSLQHRQGQLHEEAYQRRPGVAVTSPGQGYASAASPLAFHQAPVSPGGYSMASSISLASPRYGGGAGGYYGGGSGMAGSVPLSSPLRQSPLPMAAMYPAPAEAAHWRHVPASPPSSSTRPMLMQPGAAAAGCVAEGYGPVGPAAASPQLPPGYAAPKQAWEAPLPASAFESPVAARAAAAVSPAGSAALTPAGSIHIQDFLRVPSTGSVGMESTPERLGSNFLVTPASSTLTTPMYSAAMRSALLPASIQAPMAAAAAAVATGATAGGAPHAAWAAGESTAWDASSAGGLRVGPARPQPGALSMQRAAAPPPAALAGAGPPPAGWPPHGLFSSAPARPQERLLGAAGGAAGAASAAAAAAAAVRAPAGAIGGGVAIPAAYAAGPPGVSSPVMTHTKSATALRPHAGHPMPSVPSPPSLSRAATMASAAGRIATAGRTPQATYAHYSSVSASGALAATASASTGASVGYGLGFHAGMRAASAAGAAPHGASASGLPAPGAVRQHSSASLGGHQCGAGSGAAARIRGSAGGASEQAADRGAKGSAIAAEAMNPLYRASAAAVYSTAGGERATALGGAGRSGAEGLGAAVRPGQLLGSPSQKRAAGYRAAWH